MRYTTLTDATSLSKSKDEALGIIAATTFLGRDDGESLLGQRTRTAAGEMFMKLAEEIADGKYPGHEETVALRVSEMLTDVIDICSEQMHTMPREDDNLVSTWRRIARMVPAVSGPSTILREVG